MKIVILGAGAVGGLFGGLLAKAGQDVWMLEKDKDLVGAIKENGVSIINGGETICARVNVTSDPQEIQSCDLVLLCVKSFDTGEAVRGITHLIKGEATLLTLQTGLGNLETAGSIVPIQNILGGITYNGSTLLSPGRVRHTARGATFIGEVDGKETLRVSEIAQTFNAAGIETEISDNIIGHIWSKAIVYSGINPLTATFQAKNGQLLDRMASVSLLTVIVEEGMEVAKAYGKKFVYDDPYEQLFAICKKTSEHISPMLQDIMNHRKTEIEALNGAIVARGKKVGIPTPVNSTLANIIKFLEKKDN
ncbi:MAG: 2-dehydropantoate 2-reductase [bacterium]|nr:2-dehydropantoate 2-reductase [bacterium]